MPKTNTTATTKVTVADGVDIILSAGKLEEKKRWCYDGPYAIIKLDVDVTHPKTRKQNNSFWETLYRLHTTIQRDALARIAASEAATHERKKTYTKDLKDVDGSPKCDKDGVILTRPISGTQHVRERVGLTKSGIAKVASSHVKKSKWMKDYVTEALALHVADQVWKPVQRYLYKDKTGKRQGKIKVTRWYDYTRVPGRAKRHNKPRVWETFRLVGSLQAHYDTYTTEPYRGSSITELLEVPAGQQILNQPRHLPTPTKPKGRGGWWNYNGPLAVIYVNQTGEDIVYPIRLPESSGQLPYIEHYLNHPEMWHKLDFIRVQDVTQPDGWRFQFHLTTMNTPYVSPTTVERRAQVPTDRVATMDVNVSNIAFASMPKNPDVEYDEPMRISQLGVTSKDIDHALAQERYKARLQRKNDRSRHANNPGQYELSKQQQDRADRRKKKGLPEKHVQVHSGSRKLRKDGKPQQAYKHDILSKTYRKVRAETARVSYGMAKDKDRITKLVAVAVVLLHGNFFLYEKGNLTGWFKMWAKRLRITTPGRTRMAIINEAIACGGGAYPISTYNTALSQTCVCGNKEKKPLSQRVHWCGKCGLLIDRDQLSAIVGNAVVLKDFGEPNTARVDKKMLAVVEHRTLLYCNTVQKDGLDQSTAPSVHVSIVDGKDGSNKQVLLPLLVKRGRMCPIPKQTTRERRRNRIRHTRPGSAIPPV